MQSIRIVKKVKSSMVKLRELEEFRGREVEIVIRPISHRPDLKRNKNDLLKLSVWDIKESDVKVKSWKIKRY